MSLQEVMQLSVRRVYTLLAGLLANPESGLSRALFLDENEDFDSGWSPTVRAGKVVDDPVEAANLLEQMFGGAKHRKSGAA